MSHLAPLFAGHHRQRHGEDVVVGQLEERFVVDEVIEILDGDVLDQLRIGDEEQRRAEHEETEDSVGYQALITLTS